MVTREQDSLRQRWEQFQQLDRLRNHWYPRPGFRPGRSFYTWHLTFDGAHDLHRLVRHLQTHLDPAAHSLVPIHGLHLTMQGISFTDEITDTDLTALIGATQTACRTMQPFELTLGPADPDAEGIGLLVTPWEPVEYLRRHLRTAIGQVRDTVPETDDGFRPHITIAYSRTNTPTDHTTSILTTLRQLPPATAFVDAAQLIALRSHDETYVWDVVATVKLDTPVAGTPPRTDS